MKKNLAELSTLRSITKAPDKRRFRNVYALPLNQMIGQMHASPPETFIGQIPYYLNEINKNLETLRKNDVKKTALLQDASESQNGEQKAPPFKA